MNTVARKMLHIIEAKEHPSGSESILSILNSCLMAWVQHKLVVL